MKSVAALVLFLISGIAFGQTVTLNPTVTPALFRYDSAITVTYDVTGTSLASLSSAWIWVWVPTGGSTAINAQSNVTPASSNPTLTNAAEFTKSIVAGKTLFTITFTPSTFFTVDISSYTTLGMLLKGNDWPNGQTTDYLATFWDGSFQVKLVSPTQQPLFVVNGQMISVQAETPILANYSLSVNNVVVNTQSNELNYSYTLTVSDSVNFYNVTLSATAGTTNSTSFSYLIAGPSPSVPRPAGIIDGINYSSDQTKITLSLWAPQKSSVYVIGDFNNWTVQPAYLMNKSGEHFWLEVDGLTAGTEYAFQYLVDQTLFVADPYADKVLDHSYDASIPATTYPNLKAYPAAAVHSQSYFNIASVLQTGQTPYVWTATSYQKPVKEKLIIYELLIRDFFASPNQNYQSLIDTIGYFKRMGVNAIELMPVTEFTGNDSWGYNPTFMFAPDKFYGTKDKMKEFIDTAHKNGIAVIMDIVMNQQDLTNTYALMYYDFTNNRPAPDNPWFNVVAPHPYSVFNDLNHESTYTQKYLDTINYHWLHDYKVDGFRYDLAKGFTQFQSGTDVNLWGEYDASRVSILERMSNVIWSYQPDAYVILEHFADNSEETVLANYRDTESKGMMLWENFNYAFGQNSMGYVTGADFSASYYKNKGWDQPHEVAYMESHDEERLMYDNLTYGNSTSSYNVTNLNTALARMKATSLLFYSVPGPKMLWQFGDLGYDKSINTCTDGVTISTNCRTYDKPVLWSYESVPQRKDLQNQTADLIRMRRTFSVFSQGVPRFSSGSLFQQVELKNKPYTSSPSDSTEMNVSIIANMDVTSQTGIISFPHNGKWYEYYTANTLQLTDTLQSMTLAPGEYRLYTDFKITNQFLKATITGIEEPEPAVALYPNPAAETLYAEAGAAGVSSVALITMQGIRITLPRESENAWDVRGVAPGFYIAEVLTTDKIYKIKVIKR